MPELVNFGHNPLLEAMLTLSTWNALQRYLIDNYLTQDDFAEILGISPSYFNEMMNGRKRISISNMFSIAEETAIDVRDLVEKVDECLS